MAIQEAFPKLFRDILKINKKVTQFWLDTLISTRFVILRTRFTYKTIAFFTTIKGMFRNRQEEVGCLDASMEVVTNYECGYLYKI